LHESTIAIKPEKITITVNIFDKCFTGVSFLFRINNKRSYLFSLA
jgi:hypothetical protein